MILCCDCCLDYNETLPNNSRVTAKLESICTGFLLLCFWMQTSLLNFYRWMVELLARTHFRKTVSRLKSSFSCLRFCFWARIVLHINFLVNNGCRQPQFLMFSKTKALLLWFSSLQLAFYCFQTCCSTAEHLHNKRYYS